MREGEYYGAEGNGEGSHRARSRACGLRGVAFCPPAASLSAGQKNARVRVSLGRSCNDHEERSARIHARGYTQAEATIGSRTSG